MPYSYQGETEGTARAFGKEVNVSPKHANEICFAIKGRRVDAALGFLKKVQAEEAYVPFRRYNKKVPHRKGGQPGRYPVKAARIVARVLENAKANADHRGLDTEKLKVEHASAYKAMVLERGKPKGRWKAHNIELTDIEIVVKEV